MVRYSNMYSTHSHLGEPNVELLDTFPELCVNSFDHMRGVTVGTQLFFKVSNHMLQPAGATVTITTTQL